MKNKYIQYYVNKNASMVGDAITGALIDMHFGLRDKGFKKRRIADMAQGLAFDTVALPLYINRLASMGKLLSDAEVNKSIDAATTLKGKAKAIGKGLWKYKGNPLLTGAAISLATYDGIIDPYFAAKRAYKMQPLHKKVYQKLTGKSYLFN